MRKHGFPSKPQGLPSRWELPLKLGDARRDPFGQVAAKAADLIERAARPLSIGLEPSGQVYLDDPSEVFPDEWIGTFDATLARFSRESLIYENLRDEALSRGFRAKSTR